MTKTDQEPLTAARRWADAQPTGNVLRKQKGPWAQTALHHLRAALAIEAEAAAPSALPDGLRDNAITKALIDLWMSQTVSSSTRAPDDPGPGGQAMTGWVRGEKVRDLFDALENSSWFRAALQTPKAEEEI